MKSADFFEQHGTLKRGSKSYDASLLASGLSQLSVEEARAPGVLDAVDPLDLKIFRAVFDNVDADGSGGIDADELLVLLRKLGHPNAERAHAVAFISEADQDKDGVLSFQEFLQVVVAVRADKGGNGGGKFGAVLRAALGGGGAAGGDAAQLARKLASATGDDAQLDELLRETGADSNPRKKVKTKLSTPASLDREVKGLIASQSASLDAPAAPDSIDFDDLDGIAEDEPRADLPALLAEDSEWQFMISNL